MLPYLLLALLAAFILIYATVASRKDSRALLNRERYRTFWRRFGAALVDSLIIIPVAAAGVWSESLAEFSAVIINVAVGFAVSAYSVMLHWRYGKTIGKMATGVTVLSNSDETRITLRQAILRDSPLIAVETIYILLDIFYLVGGTSTVLVSSVEAVLLWFPLFWYIAEFMTMLSNEKRRAIHDLIAGTVVVKDV